MSNLDEVVHDFLSGNRVYCWHGEASDWLLGVDQGCGILGSELGPFLELGVLEVDVVIEDGLSGRESGSLELLFPPGGELLPVLTAVLDVETGTEAPYATEHEDKGETFDGGVLKDGLQKLAKRDNHRDLDLRDEVFESSLDVSECLLKVLIEVALKLLLTLRVIGLLLQPRLDVGLPLGASCVGDEENTSTGHGGRGGESQVSNLEDQSHVALKRNTLVGGQSEDSVVVHDRVHGLDPVSIKITVEDDPLGVGVWNLTETTHSGGHKSIDPLTSLHVHNTIKLVSLDDLRVEIVVDGLAAVTSVGISKGLPGARLTSAGRSHHEDTMTDLEQLRELDNLEDEVLIGVKLEASCGFSALLLEGHVSLSGRVNAWEQVTKQVHEDLQVLSDNLGQVEISESSHEKIRLG